MKAQNVSNLKFLIENFYGDRAYIFDFVLLLGILIFAYFSYCSLCDPAKSS